MKSCLFKWSALLLMAAVFVACSAGSEIPSWTFGVMVPAADLQKNAKATPDWKFDSSAQQSIQPVWEFKAEVNEAPSWAFAVDTASVKEPKKPEFPKLPACECPSCECGKECKCCKDAANDLRYAEAFDLARKQGKGVILSIGQPANVRDSKRLEAKLAGKIFASEDFPPSVDGFDLHAGLYDWGPPAAVAVEAAVPIASQSFAPVYGGGCANGRCGMR